MTHFRFALALIAVAAAPLTAQASKSFERCATVFIKAMAVDYDTSGTAESYARVLENFMSQELWDGYDGAASVLTAGDARTLIQNDRDRALLGASRGTETLDKVARAFDADYFLLLQVTRSRSAITLTANLYRPSKTKVLAHRERSLTAGGLTADLKAFVKEVAREVAYVAEICPYQGPVTARIVETRKSSRTSTGSVFCNKEWRALNRSNTVDNSDDQHWQLERRMRSGGSKGKLTWRVSENTRETEEHGCYPCRSGTPAARTSDRKVTTTTEVEGVSRASAAVDPELWDAIVRLEFKKDSTYTVFVRAASDRGLARRTISHAVTGACDTDGENENRSGARSAPLELRLGPFRGTPFDKQLRAKDRIDVKQTDEWVSYIEFSFDLKRKR